MFLILETPAKLYINVYKNKHQCMHHIKYYWCDILVALKDICESILYYPQQLMYITPL